MERGLEQKKNRDLPQSGADQARPSGSEGGCVAAGAQAVGGCGGRTEATVGQILELLCGIDTLSKCDEKSLDRCHGCIGLINVLERCSLLCGQEPVFKENSSKEVARRQLAVMQVLQVACLCPTPSLPFAFQRCWGVHRWRARSCWRSRPCLCLQPLLRGPRL